jgi:glucosamine--fructose-6-phosphate aminotransferase (isomerizing)
MKTPRLQNDILSQPESLLRVLRHQTGTGRAALVEAGAALRSARRVVITGMGASMYAGIPLEYQLCALGINAMVVESGELLHYRLGACENSAVVMVSRSGESVEIAMLLEKIRGKCVTVGVSNEPHSRLALRVDHSIQVSSLADEMVAIQTYTGTVLTLHLLAGAVAGTLDVAAAEAEASIDALRPFIAGGQALEHWDTFLHCAPPVCNLGRGPSCGSAFEASLLFNETAKVPAMGMPAASFRHGPVEQVNDKFVGFVFAPLGPTRAINLALARDLVRFGGQVRVVGPAGDDTAGLALCEVPPVSDALAPLVEIVPVQFAALRLAQLRGLKVGHFFYTPQVTVDESAFVR